MTPQEKVLKRAEIKADREKQKADKADRLAKEKTEREAQASAAPIEAKTTLDEQAGLFLTQEAQRRAYLASLPKGATRNAEEARAAKAGKPYLSPEEARQAAEDEVMRKLSSTTTTDKDGKPLDAGQRRGVSKAIVGDAQADIARQTIGLNQANLNATEKLIAIARDLQGKIGQQHSMSRRQHQQINTMRPTDLPTGGF